MQENPAVKLYQHWREMIRYRAEHQVRFLIDDANESLSEKTLNIDDVEEHSKSMMGRWSRHADLNYRFSVNVVGISDVHLPERLFPDCSDWEPILEMVQRAYGHTSKMMTLWPNGDFIMHYEVSPLFDRWTFWRSTYVVGRRAWLVRDPASEGWVRGFDGRNPDVREPYLRTHHILTGDRNPYELVYDGSYWRVKAIQHPNRVAYPEWGATITEPHEVKLAEGYNEAERRYNRFKRSAELAGGKTPRHKVSLYVPGEGRLTGQQAVNRFADRLRVYPAEAPKEAH